MFYIRQAYALFRDVQILTDLLDWGHKNRSAIHVFKIMGIHDGIHEMCPGWCPCDVDYDIDEELALAA